jgi:hypothetical protein
MFETMAKNAKAAAPSNAANDNDVVIKLQQVVVKEGAAMLEDYIKAPKEIGRLFNGSNLTPSRLIGMLKNKIEGFIKLVSVVKQGIVVVEFDQPWNGIQSFSFPCKFSNGMNLLSDISMSIVKTLRNEDEDAERAVRMALGFEYGDLEGVISQIAAIWRTVDIGDNDQLLRDIKQTKAAISVTRKEHEQAHRARLDADMAARGYKTLTAYKEERRLIALTVKAEKA